LPGRGRTRSAAAGADDRAEDDEDDRDLHKLVLIAEPLEEAVQREADDVVAWSRGALEDQEDQSDRMAATGSDTGGDAGEGAARPESRFRGTLARARYGCRT
jgi:hypothetical protein